MKYIVSLMLLVLVACQPATPPKDNNQAELKETVILTDLEVPWDLSFAPDGSLYFTERAKTVSVLAPGETEAKPLELELKSPLRVEGEAGLMGLALDPDFAETAYLYICYSYFDSDTALNRVSRLTESGNRLTAELVLVDAIPGGVGHDGCRLAFGADGFLYISTGNAQEDTLSQDTSSLAGKILRIGPEGSIPEDNPFDNPVWTYGHRNPQGLAFAADGKLYSSEHGPANDDEINLIEKGRNYGWPEVEGFCDLEREKAFCSNNNVAEPLIAYTPTLAVAGIDIYTGSMFPDWQNKLLMVSLKASEFHVIDLAQPDSENDKTVIADTYGRLRDVALAPDGSVYIATSNRDGRADSSQGFPKENDDVIIRLSKE